MAEEERRPSDISAVKTMFDVETGLTAFLKAEVIASRGWSTLIFDQNIRWGDPQALAAACARAGYASAVGVDIDHGQYDTINIDLDVDGITSLRNAFFSPSFALIEVQERFIIASDADYYWTIAGERSFVESISDKHWEVHLDELEERIAPCNHTQDEILARVWRNMTAYVALCRSSFGER